MKNSGQNNEELKAEYTCRYEAVLVRLASALGTHFSELMANQPRIDRITARAKDVDRFVKKADNRVDGIVDGILKYDDPLSQIQDQIGARIVVFYESDVERMKENVNKYFTAIEHQNMVPDTESEFGYFGHHLVLVLPTDVIEADMDRTLIPEFFELQIKTLFQHAWSEAEHEIGYKPGDKPLSSKKKRLIAFTSAQAWGADHIFDRLFKERSA